VRGRDGALYVCDVGNHAVRRVARDGPHGRAANRGNARRGVASRRP
jgi:hypothetical protein